MAQNSFDIVSEIDWQEIDNAVNQARKEIQQRYDFKGSKSSIDINQKEKKLVIIADDDYKLRAVNDILQNKMIKRSVPLKSLKYHEAETASGGMLRQTIDIQQGISTDNARKIVKMIKDTKKKVQSQIMDDQVRVSGKDKDELQSIIQMIRDADLDFAVQFTNYR